MEPIHFMKCLPENILLRYVLTMVAITLTLKGLKEMSQLPLMQFPQLDDLIYFFGCENIF